MFVTTMIICIQYNNPLSLSMVATNRIICIWYNDPFPHPWSPPTGSFVFDTTIHINIHIHAHHSHDHLYSIQWSSGHCDTSSTPYTHPHHPTTRSWPQADFSTYAWLWCCLTSSSPTTPRTWWILGSAEAWWRCWTCYHLSVHISLEFCHLWPPHGWNDIIGRCASFLHGIYCPLPADGSLIVAWDGEWFFFSSLNLFHKTPKPDPLLGCMHLRDVFCLCTRQRYNSLLFGAPWDCPDTKMEQESGYWVPVLLTSPVCIAESFYQCFLLSSKGKPKIFRASEIVNDLF